MKELEEIIKPNEDCDAEYFFCSWFDINSIPKRNMILPGHEICELMEEYHRQKLRSELIAYENWRTDLYNNSDGDEIVATIDEMVTEYLKQRK